MHAQAHLACGVPAQPRWAPSSSPCAPSPLCNGRNCSPIRAALADAFVGAADAPISVLGLVLLPALAAWYERPLGWAAYDLLEVQSSAIHGRGVFARTSIAKGTPLGVYPGRVRTADEMLAKAQRSPEAKQYVFRTDETPVRFVDPTDVHGQPSRYPGPGLPWPFALDCTLAFVNEPPPRSRPNVEVDTSQGPRIIFKASEDIAPGEELFVDYGTTYDRTSYGPAPGADPRQR